MKKIKLAFGLGLVVIVLAGCSDELIEQGLQTQDLKTQEIALKAGHEKFVPLKGTFEVTIAEVIHPGPPPPKILRVTGNGKLSHLGKTDVELIQKWWPPGPPPLVPPWEGTGIGELTFTAANGDVLLATYSNAVALHAEDGLVYTTLTGVVEDGGTGRFENASGEFEWNVTFDPDENTGTVTLDGKIWYIKNK